MASAHGTRQKGVNVSSGKLAGLRRWGLWVLFSSLLLIPKMIGLRRRPRTWNRLRWALGLLGAILVISAVAGHIRPGRLVLGIFLGLLAAFFVPERRRPSADERARELGAVIIVNGGIYRLEDGKPIPVQLFVGTDRAWVLDLAQHVLKEFPFADLQVRAEQDDAHWVLHIASSECKMDFLYEGPFAEHLARVAESTLRDQMQPRLPVLR